MAFAVLCTALLAFLPVDGVDANHGAAGAFDGTDGALDPGAANLVDVCAADGDDILRNGAAYKLNAVHTATTPPSVVVQGTAAGKSDLCDIWLATENVGDDIYLYLAWERASTTGSTVMAFEFQQAGITCIADPADPNDTCNPFAQRQAGDFLITYDFQGNEIDIGRRVFDGASFGPLIPVGAADFEASLSGDEAFGEAVINLTGDPAIIPPDPDECLSVANIIPMTVTGNSDQAEVMDIVIDDLADEIGISNCGTLEVRKVTVPAGLSGMFEITVDGSELDSPLQGTLTGDGDAEVFVDLFDASDYSVVESVPNGWHPDYGVVCSLEDGSATGAGTNVEVIINQTTTCVITNTAIEPQLTLLKTVVNDNGGTSVDTDWTLTASGPIDISGIEGSGAVTSATVPIGVYQLSETGPDGYDTVGWACDGVAGDSVQLGPGDVVTCEVVNDDIPSRLILIKNVVTDDGGDADRTDWTLTASGPTLLSGPGGARGEVLPGLYTLSESSGPAGYEASVWECVGGQQKGASVRVPLGETVECSITNDDIAPILTLEKDVINDDGGTAVDTDFLLEAAGPVTIAGIEGDAAITAASVLAGTYLLSETGPSGYALEGWACSGGSLVGDELTLALGDTALCTATNGDVPATLTLVKVVINDDGGTELPTSWTLTADGPTPLSGATGNGAVTNVPVTPGTYELSEAGPSGYSASDWVCAGGTQQGASVEIALGDDVTCTVTNDDIPASLTLIKQVLNSNGGLGLPADWLLSAVGPTTLSGFGQVSGAVPAGSYNLSESGPAGYSTDGFSCDGGSQVGDLLTLAPGESATCLILNRDIAPSLTVVKVVETGSASPDDFGLTVNGDPIVSGQTLQVVANTPLNVAEQGLAGYVQTGLSCIDDETGEAVGNPVTLALAQRVTCTVVNNELGSVTVIKQAIPATGSFDFALTPGDVQSVDGDGGTHTWSDLAPGPYDLTESTPVDWTLEEVSCDVAADPIDQGVSLDLDYGVHVTCVFTNGRAPTLTVVKAVNEPTQDSFAFDLDGDPFELGSGESTTFVLLPGAHQVTESVAPGWLLDGVSCDVNATSIDSGVELALDYGDNATCTFSNVRVVDLSIAKTDLADPIFLNDEVPVGSIIYNITVANIGLAPATGVTLVDTLASSTTYVNAVPQQGTCSHASGVVTCELGDLDVGASVLITVTVETESIDNVSNFLVTNVVEVGSDQVDSDPSNNDAVEDTTIVAVLPLPPITPPVPPQVDPPVAQLPATGLGTEELGLLALALIAIGATIVRRRPDESDLS